MKRSAFPPRKTPMRHKRTEAPAVSHEIHPTALKPVERAGVYAKCGGEVVSVPKGEPLRDKSYRRWVASLPCYECRIHGYSQCAHGNTGKAKGLKNSDEGCFPLCADRVGVKGCHSRFDQYEIVSRADMPEYERRAAEWTKEQLSN
jgi:hypothetical protein